VEAEQVSGTNRITTLLPSTAVSVGSTEAAKSEVDAGMAVAVIDSVVITCVFRLVRGFSRRAVSYLKRLNLPLRCPLWKV
jgi:hypothetical protein